MGDRIGIAGLNGSGKSTLVSLAIGVDTNTGKAALPTSGTVARHTRAKIGLYSQQSAEEMEKIAADDPKATALSHITAFLGPGTVEQDARALLSGVGLAGKIASDVPIALLSGGQRVRLALAKVLSNPPHLLILDEVTTHLDTDTIQALVTALKTYEGALLVVTHDRFFMRCVVEGESMRKFTAVSRPEDLEDDTASDESESEEEDFGKRTRVVYRLTKGKLIKLERGMEQYEEIAARSATRLGKV
jgi:ATPase subunit of ABC transporter with duplicated ATPase domains